ncbi:MAG: efflux RND transporter permease subunit, partial [Flavobacteriaceae bacterium]|nr:efflux RND transporter permease subunit [Flavobacteriaceae bacterium]
MAEKNPEKEFFLSSWAIDRPTLIYVIVSLFLILGISAYFNMPRENFPEVKETKIYISSLYPGNTAEDVERLITDPLEDRLKNVSNVVEITSTSQEDFSIIIVEFDEEISVENAKQKVKDEVDTEKSNEDWPTFNNAKIEPNVFDLNLSEEMPIMNINITGDYPIEQLKFYAEIIQDEVENIAEIKQADLRGVQDLEVEVAVDIYQMMAAKVSFDDVINSIRNGNVTISGGNLISSDQRRTIRVIGEIDQPKNLNSFVVKDLDGAVYLKDVAEVSFHEKEKTSYARTYSEPVVMLDVKKRAGKNMIEAVDKIKASVVNLQAEELPKDIHISYANDQSEKTLNQVNDLVNNIIFGIILVITIIMFFIGFRNALFIGFAIPMSMFISFMLLSFLGYTLNTMILFGLIMGLGMLVDNGIVVVENVYRLMDEEGMTRIDAAKKGIGEIAMPIIVSTITTVAAFVPLGLWPGIMGEFMILFPITLSVVLGSSLFVAIFVNSMLVSQFMETEEKNLSRNQLLKLSLILVPLGVLILIFGGQMRGLGSVMLATALMFWAYKYLVKGAAIRFQRNFLVKVENFYEKTLRFSLHGIRPYVLSFLMVVLFVVVNGLYFGWSVSSGRTKVEFFPDNKPNQIIVYIEYPEGTDIEKTNRLTKTLEALVYEEIQREEYQYQGKNLLVESAVSQVGEGAGNPQTDMGNTAEMPHRAKITATMPEYKYRRGKDSETLRQRIQEKLEGKFPGVLISVEKDAVGPPVGYPINIELIGKDYDEMIVTAEQMIDFINSKNIGGIESLKIDVNKKKPILKVNIDREKSGTLGMSAGQ